jgi:flagellar FliJ protein
MAKPSSMQILIELAQSRTDDAARRLGALNTQRSELENQLQLLIQYRDEYCRRYEDSVKSGISVTDCRNFQDFLAKLDKAIGQQQQALMHAQTGLEAGQQAWHSARRTLKSYDTLSQRQVRAERQHEAKREQKQTDEYASKPLPRDPTH